MHRSLNPIAPSANRSACLPMASPLCSPPPFLQSTHPLCSPSPYLPTAPSVLAALNPIALSAHRPLSCPPPLYSTPPLCPRWGDRIWHWRHDSFSFHLLKPTNQPTLFLFTCVRAGLYVGLVWSSYNELTFWSQLKYCFLLISITTWDKCDLMCHIRPRVTMSPHVTM